MRINWEKIALWGLLVFGFYLIFPYLAGAGILGILVKVVIAGVFLAGMVAAIVNQSPTSFVIGIGSAFAIRYFFPG